jgi:hypothetical protein
MLSSTPFPRRPIRSKSNHNGLFLVKVGAPTEEEYHGATNPPQSEGLCSLIVVHSWSIIVIVMIVLCT